MPQPWTVASYHGCLSARDDNISCTLPQGTGNTWTEPSKIFHCWVLIDITVLRPHNKDLGVFSRILHQGLRQDLETGCLKLAIIKLWGVQNFKGDQKILIVMGIIWRWKIQLQVYAWDWHFKKFFTKSFGCPEGCFKGLGVQKDTQTPCWLRLCFAPFLLTKKHYCSHYHGLANFYETCWSLCQNIYIQEVYWIWW